MPRKNPLACLVCDFKSKYLSSFRKHVKLHNGKGSYKCPTCSYTVSDRRHLTVHRLRHHKHVAKDQSVKTSLEEVSANAVELPQNNKSHQGSRRVMHKCTYCDYTTKFTTNMRLHEDRHLQNGKFCCTWCSYSSTFKHLIDIHMTRHHRTVRKTGPRTSKARYCCSICDYSTNNSSHLTRHKTRHLQSGRFTCTVCNYSSKSSGVIQCHLKLHHFTASVPDKPNPQKDTPAKPRSNKFQCRLCSFSAATGKCLKAHVKREHRGIIGQRPQQDDRVANGAAPASKFYKCPKCLYSSEVLRNFHEHFIKHETEPAFRCSYGDFSSKYRSKLNRHIRLKKLVEKDHGDAKAIMIFPIPEHQYAVYLRDGNHVNAPSRQSDSVLDHFDSVGPLASYDNNPANLEDLLRFIEENGSVSKTSEREVHHLDKEEAKCRREIGQHCQAVGADFRSLTAARNAGLIAKQKEKLEDVRRRAEIMVDKVRIETKLVIDIMAQKACVLKKMKGLRRGSRKAEEKEDELRNLDEDLWIAQGSQFGYEQVLNVLQAELECLEGDQLQRSNSSIEELKDRLRARIAPLVSSEERLVKIAFINSLSSVGMKRKKWLEEIAQFHCDDGDRLCLPVPKQKQ